ncbi:hypothetical protein ACN08Y_05380 [Rothia sp. P5764]
MSPGHQLRICKVDPQVRNYLVHLQYRDQSFASWAAQTEQGLLQ